ncbi:MAG: pitrilysin family protein [archaeon]
MKFTKKVLDNGLTILHEKRDVPVTTVAIASKFGAAYETESEKGISHVIEHLCFKGTKKRSMKEISSEIEKIGGILNAFTHEEVTLYHAKLPSKHMNVALDVLFDVYFNPSFPEEEMNKEIKVICEEIKMRKDNPRVYVCDRLKQNLYEKPFGLNVSGDEKTILALTRKDILAKHGEKYCPANSILCVVGNNSLEDVMKFVNKFSFSKNSPAARGKEPKKINLNSEDKREGIEQANLAMGFHFPTGQSKERYAAQLFNAIFGDGMSSKLFLEVREKLGLVYAIKSDFDIGKDYGYLLVYAGTDKSKVKQVISIVSDEFKKMEKTTEEELGEAKRQMIGNQLVMVEGSEESAVNLIMEEILDKAEKYYQFEKKINEVTLEEIKSLARNVKFSYSVLSP